MNKYIPFAFLFLIFIYFIWLLKPVFNGELTGTLKNSELPNEYVQLKDFLSTQEDFYRVLWFPTAPHYFYFSNHHRLVPADDFFKETDHETLIRLIKQKQTEELLRESSIKYVVIPFDSEGNIFITDRKYDEMKYNKVIRALDSIVWLKKVKVFKKIHIYEIANPKDHFWSPSENVTLSHTYINPTQYNLTIENAKEGDNIIFSETYDPNWQAENAQYTVPAKKYKDRYNSFSLPKDGDYFLQVSYRPQQWVNLGVIISSLSLIALIGLATFLRKR